MDIGAGWSSSVARWAHNPEVAGSNPAPATSGNVPGRVLPGTFFMPDVPELYPATRVSGEDGRAGVPSSSAAHGVRARRLSQVATPAAIYRHRYELISSPILLSAMGGHGAREASSLRGLRTGFSDRWLDCRSRRRR